MRGFDAADSERSVRPESPTSPNGVIGTYRGNKTSVPNARGRTVNPLSSDELDSEEMRRVTVESSLISCLRLNSIVSMTRHAACSEASSANYNNSWCSLSPCTRSSRVVRAVDTIDGQLFIDLTFKVEGEDVLRASIYQIFHWKTNPVHKVEQGSRTSSDAADLVKIFPKSTKIQV